MISPLYRSRALYHLAMRALYGRHNIDRYRTVADLVPAGARVLELCAGDCTLFLQHLQHKNVEYAAIDNAPAFVDWARRHGIVAELGDVRTVNLPPVDIVIMQASLYQFLPGAGAMVERMLDAAAQTVIIAEPVRNLASSRWPVVARAAKRLTIPFDGADCAGERFARASFLAFMQDTGRLQSVSEIPGGRELVVCLAGRRAPAIY